MCYILRRLVLVSLFQLLLPFCVIDKFVYGHHALDVFIDLEFRPTDLCVEFVIDFVSNTSVCICGIFFDDWLWFYYLDCRCHFCFVH